MTILEQIKAKDVAILNKSLAINEKHKEIATIEAEQRQLVLEREELNMQYQLSILEGE